MKAEDIEPKELIKIVKDFANFKLQKSFIVYRTKDGIETQVEKYPFSDYKSQINKPLHSMPDFVVEDIPSGGMDCDYRTYQHVQTESRNGKDVLIYLER